MDIDNIMIAYKTSLESKLVKIINENIGNLNANILFDKHFLTRITQDRTSRKQFIEFQKYYFRTLGQVDKINFNSFKQKYSLQGVDASYLKKLSDNKEKIIGLINSDDLTTLYFEYFHFQKIETKSGIKTKSLGSFFTKLVHTFKPEDYTPVDMPMKKFFDLNNESYFISMIVISTAFKKWANENRTTVDEFKRLLVNYMKENIDISMVTDIKVMDTIFWSIAN